MAPNRYSITVRAEFAAAHALVIAGTREPLHGHNWLVLATIAGPTLDADGLLCDFHTVEDLLRELTGQFHNRNLNEIEPFTELNPSAENVARYLADELSSGLGAALAPHARVESVSVTEAPGCVATYRPDAGGASVGA
jgi:6-pyruvoyltetrahydropterin/6-carboxytetrahydropterin synthase